MNYAYKSKVHGLSSSDRYEGWAHTKFAIGAREVVYVTYLNLKIEL